MKLTDRKKYADAKAAEVEVVRKRAIRDRGEGVNNELV